MTLPPPLHAQVLRYQTAFRAHPARRLALFLEHRHAFAAALLAAWAEGRQVVLPGDVLPQTIEGLRPHVDAFVGDFQGVATLAPQVEPAPRPGFSHRGEAADGVAWVDPSPLMPFALAPDREALGLVVFTSGSTGAPVAIPKRLRQLFDEVQTLEATFGARIDAQARVFSTVSHQHLYGLLWAVLWPLATGRGLTEGRIDFPKPLERALGEGPCVLISSPAQLKRLPEGRAWSTGLQAVFSSGGPLSADAAQRTEAVLGQRPIEVYGSSETGGVAWRSGTTPWRPLSGVALRSSPTGTLALKGPHLPDDGWFVTDDAVRFEGEGFTLLGRLDRIVKVEDQRVSLAQVEAATLGTGLLAQARAVLLQGPRVTLGLVGVLSEAGQRCTRAQAVAQLKAALAQSIVPVAAPRRFRFVDAFPEDAQGKTQQARLAMLFAPERPVATWRARAEGEASLRFEVTADLRVLDGHFPGTPVVPGVAQLDWAIGWGLECFAIEGQVARVEALKFQAPMLPGRIVQLVLAWNLERGTLTFRYGVPPEVFSSGRVVFVP